MRQNIFLKLFLLVFFLQQMSADESFVVISTESAIDIKDSYNNENIKPDINPQIYSMDISSNINNRFATTLVISRVKNSLKIPAETTFSVILPKNAFISEFLMETQEKIYKAEVKEKSEASRIYQNALSGGKSAGKVETTARDSNTFTVSVNVEPESKTTFKLTYEELLERELERYELVLNIHPGQIVDDLNVEVHIAESRPLKFVKTPALRTGNEINNIENENLDPNAQVEIVNKSSAIVKFKPDDERQKQFAEALNVDDKENGIKGQFIVQYDVERDPQGGEVLVKDGYFVHFFAPADLTPIPKHIVFVLDHSGSMLGRKIEQLIDAMQNILSELQSEDIFHLIRFGNEASVWDINQNVFQVVSLENPVYGDLEPLLKSKNLPGPTEASPDNIAKAKEIIKDQNYLSSTNIIAGLEVALFLLNNNRAKRDTLYQPMIFFLTDGYPNEGLVDPNEIIRTVRQLNSGPDRSSMFCLSFGEEADRNFLQRLCLDNLGFSRHIYEAADASLQLENFYQKISSPLLRNVQFKYVDGVSDVTRDYHPILFNGCELVVSGKTPDNVNNISISVDGVGRDGQIINLRPLVEAPVSKLERLWAYLTVKQILEESKKDGNNEQELRTEALNLALKYSFVTEVSSLVVAKQDQNITNCFTEEDDYAPAQYNSMTVDENNYNKVTEADPPMTVDQNSYNKATETDSPMTVVTETTSPPLESTTMMTTTTTNKPRRKKKNKKGRPRTRSPQKQLDFAFVGDSSIIRVKPLSLADKIKKHIQVLTNGTEQLITPQGTFKFGNAGAVKNHPECPKTPSNGTGECRILYDCPVYFSLITDLDFILNHFCPLENKYVGVCCPK